MTVPGGDAPTDLLFCYRHPNRPTGVRCTRCERPICPECMIPASVGFQCPECVTQGRRSTRMARTVYGGQIRPGSRVAMVTQVLIALNIAMFVITSVGGGLSIAGDNQSHVFYRLALVPAAVGHGQWYRLLTAMFMHVNVLHIAFNMYALYIIGPPLEAALGRSRFIVLYLLAGLGGSVLSAALGPTLETAAGASGAIFGLFGAFYLAARHQRLETGGIVATIVLNLVFTFSFSGVIDWRAHVGGLITGAAVMAVLAYAPTGPRRATLQVAGVAAVAVIVAAVGYAGARHADHNCPILQSRNGVPQACYEIVQ